MNYITVDKSRNIITIVLTIVFLMLGVYFTFKVFKKGNSFWAIGGYSLAAIALLYYGVRGVKLIRQ